MSKLITVTDASRKVLTEQSDGLQSVTLVALSKAARQKDRGATDSLAKFESVELETYLTDTEVEADPLTGAQLVPTS